MAINYRQQYSQYSRYFVRLKDIYNQRVEVRESLELLLSLLLISFLVIFAIRPTVNTIAELFANLESQKQNTLWFWYAVVALVSALAFWGFRFARRERKPFFEEVDGFKIIDSCKCSESAEMRPDYGAGGINFQSKLTDFIPFNAGG